jgi:hypothetical protein
MVFSSTEFLFLPPVLALYRVTPRRSQNALLLPA